jgi:hypothetical protein
VNRRTVNPSDGELPCDPSSPGSGRPEAANESGGRLSKAQQHQVILLALKAGPKTSYDLRRLGVYQHSTRIFELRQLGHAIDTELTTLWDRDGFEHPRCARYTLDASPAGSATEMTQAEAATDVATSNVLPLFPSCPPPANAADAAERRGAGAGLDAIDAMRNAPTQSERYRVLHEAILTATKGPHRSRAAGGLALSLVAFLDRALGLGG